MKKTWLDGAKEELKADEEDMTVDGASDVVEMDGACEEIEDGVSEGTIEGGPEENGADEVVKMPPSSDQYHALNCF